MANKIKQKRMYATPRSAYISNINVPDEIPTRANINAMNQAYSDARQQANNVITQYELNKRKSILQDSIDRNLVNERILSIGESQRPIDTRQLNDLFFNRTQFKTGGNTGRKRYAVGGTLSNRINRRNYWFDENDGVVEFNSDTPTPSENTDNTSESNSVVTIGTKSFASAFKQARTAGLDRFKWHGKTYTTEMAGENTKTTPKPSEAKVSSNNNTNRIRRRSRNTNNSTQRNQQRTISNNQNRQSSSVFNRTTNNTNNNQQRTNSNVSTTTTRRIAPTRSSTPVKSYQDYVNTSRNSPNVLNTPVNQLPNYFASDQARLINSANLRGGRTSNNENFYDARRRAQQAGKRSFTYRGQTYNAYGTLSNQAGTYGRKR